jgi:hypothetical protein
MSRCGKRTRARAAARLGLALMAVALPACGVDLSIESVPSRLQVTVYVTQENEAGATVNVAADVVPRLATLHPEDVPLGVAMEVAPHTMEVEGGAVAHVGRPQKVVLGPGESLVPGVWDVTIRLTTSNGEPSEVTCDVTVDSGLIAGGVTIELEWVEGSEDCTSPAETSLDARDDYDVGVESVEVANPPASTGRVADVRAYVKNVGREDVSGAAVSAQAVGPDGIVVPLTPAGPPPGTLVADGQLLVSVPFQWTPPMIGAYTLTAEVAPVSGEIGEDSNGPFNNVEPGGDGLANRDSVSVIVVGDEDGDGVLDAVDNCQLRPNAEQRDVDGDGHGDACDLAPLIWNPGQEDSDGDGIPDVSELQVLAFVPSAVVDPAEPCIPNCGDLVGSNCLALLGERLIATQVEVRVDKQLVTNSAGCDGSGQFLLVGPSAMAAAGQSVTVTHTTEGTTVTAPKPYGYLPPSCAPTAPAIDAVWPRDAVVGARVSVAGCGFVGGPGGSTVELEPAAPGPRVPATGVNVVMNGDLLGFTVPPGVGSGRIRIVNPNGAAVVSTMVLEIR